MKYILAFVSFFFSIEDVSDGSDKLAHYKLYRHGQLPIKFGFWVFPRMNRNTLSCICEVRFSTSTETIIPNKILFILLGTYSVLLSLWHSIFYQWEALVGGVRQRRRPPGPPSNCVHTQPEHKLTSVSLFLWLTALYLSYKWKTSVRTLDVDVESGKANVCSTSSNDFSVLTWRKCSLHRLRVPGNLVGREV